MTLLASDTSLLISLGCADHHQPSALDLLREGFDVVVPEELATELEQLASYEHDHQQEAIAAQTALSKMQVVSRVDIPESVPPLDLSERAAIAIANSEQAQYLLCDEFINLTLIASTLGDTQLLTTPGLIIAFVQRGKLSKADGQVPLAEIAELRSWENNAFYQRSRRLLDRLE